MKFFDRFKSKSSKPMDNKKLEKKQDKSPKDIATAKGEPYVAILNIDINPESLHEGSFELDWNDKFIANLVRAGYQMKPNEPEDAIVDRWFQNVCRHVVMETWEQEQAMNVSSSRHIQKRDLGDGRSEIS